MMALLDLFSGIGGFSLGLERSGAFKTVAFCECDPYARRVLARHWPEVPIYPDVRQLTAGRLRADGIAVDAICGGFPCQPHSIAGQRRGSDDERDLWPEFARLIREIRPRWVLAENVPGIRSINDGRFFGGVLRDLAGIGMHVEWTSISAADVGAPHLRERVWIVAYPASEQVGLAGQPWLNGGVDVSDAERGFIRDEPGRRNGACGAGAPVAGHDGAAGLVADADGARELQSQGGECAQRRRASNGSADVADAHGNAGEEPDGTVERRSAVVAAVAGGAASGGGGAAPRAHVADATGAGWNGAWAERSATSHRAGTLSQPARPDRRPAQSRLGFLADGLSAGLAGRVNPWLVEPDIPRTAHGVKHRVDRLRCLGNSLVPQIAEMIGRAVT